MGRFLFIPSQPSERAQGRSIPPVEGVCEGGNLGLGTHEAYRNTSLLHRQRLLSSWSTSIRSSPSKSPVSLPEEILIPPPSAPSLSSREANSDDNKIQIHVERVQYVPPPTEGAVSWPTSIRISPSKPPVPLPEEILIPLRPLLFLPSREAHGITAKKESLRRS